MGCPDNDRGVAIVELLDNALTKRFPCKKLGIPPNSKALSFEIFGKISGKFNIWLRVADKYVSHQIKLRATRDDWTATLSSPREAGEVEEVVAGFPDVDIEHSIDGEFLPDFGVGGAAQAVPRLLLIPEMTDWVTREAGAEAFGLGDDRPLPLFLAGRCQRRRGRQR